MLAPARRRGYGRYQYRCMIANPDAWEAPCGRSGPCLHPSVRVRFGPVDRCSYPPQTSTMNIRRNDPCPCGSGKKFKQCHGKTSTNSLSPEEAAWRRLRHALDGFPSTMLRFVERAYGPDALDEAWEEYHLWEEDAPDFHPRSSENQVFMPWFFHRWSPDPMETPVADPHLHGREPTDVFLEQKARRLDPTLREYLEACLDAPLSFHEILEVELGRGFRARNVITGEERWVMERSASGTMTPGDLFFGQLVTAEGITLMGACSPHPLSPEDKIPLIELRERINANGPIISEFLCEWDMELREEYLYMVEAIRNPPTPRLQNTDGEPIVFQTLSFEVPSAQEAFDALKGLAFDEAEEDLLAEADLDGQGKLRRVSFAWKVAGNAQHKSSDNTVLGHIEIDGLQLFASVNSQERAARFMKIMEERCPTALHTDTEVETVEEGLAKRRAEGEPPVDADAESLAEIPEVRARIQAMMAEHYEDWVEQEALALGGLSPMEAAKEEAGREKVEALITQIERQGRRMEPPLDEAITRRMREHLGLVG